MQRRRWRIALFALLGIIVVVLVGAWVYLRTGGANLVARKVGERLGVPVEVGALAVGGGSSTVRGLRIFEADADTNSEPWLRADTVEVDLGIGDLIGGSTDVRTITARGAAVVLRFDAEGRLLTKLPRTADGDGAALPTVKVEGGTLTVLQEGYPRAEFPNLTLAMREEGDRLRVSGSMRDAGWGDWTLSAEVDPETRAGSAELATDAPVRVTPERLASIPFVPASVWEEVRLDGTTTARVALTFGPTGGVTYRVEADPRDTSGFIPSVDLPLSQASGKVVVEDAVVTLTGVKSKSFGGDLACDGTLDFRGDPSRLDLHLRGQGLEVAATPDEWGLKRLVEGGRLNGDAKLTVEIPDDGPARTGGSGTGEIVGAKILGAPTEGPIEVKLVPAGGRFRFGAGNATGHILPSPSRGEGS